MNHLLSLCLVLKCIFSATTTQFGNGRLTTHDTSLSFLLPAQKKVLFMFWVQEKTPITLLYLYDGGNITGNFNYVSSTSNEPYFILIYPEEINMSAPATGDKSFKLDQKPRSLTGRVLNVSSEKNVTWEMYIASENGDEMTPAQHMIFSLAASLGLVSLISIILASYVFHLKKTTKLQPDVSSQHFSLRQNMTSRDTENSIYGLLFR